MADYIPILDSQLEPKAPVTSELMFQLRDNPLAITEGAVGAPRSVLKSFDRVAAGDVVRSSGDATGDTDFTYYFSVMQIGTVRIKGNADSNGNYVIQRVRNGVGTTIATGSTVTSFTASSVSVLPFDTLRVDWTGTPNDPEVQICTDGGDLWCGNPSIDVGVTGNDV